MNPMHQEFKCLDHGFVRAVDYMGDDQAIVQAARVSYGSGTKATSEDRGLIRYLMRHHHSTPFEMCEIKLHVKLPVFVARQWIRHRTANVNEYSARYSVMDNEFYIPEVEDILPQSQTNKQGRGGALPDAMRDAMQETIRHMSQGSYQVYTELMHGWPWIDSIGQPIDQEHDEAVPHEEGLGMARELARMVLPVNIYTQWYWKVDLHNLFHFLKLRADPHAQKEIRVYANAICEIVEAWCPLAYEAFEDYRLHAVTLSWQEVAVFQQMMANNPSAFRHILQSDNGLSERENREFLASFLTLP